MNTLSTYVQPQARAPTWPNWFKLVWKIILFITQLPILEGRKYFLEKKSCRNKIRCGQNIFWKQKVAETRFGEMWRKYFLEKKLSEQDLVWTKYFLEKIVVGTRFGVDKIFFGKKVVETRFGLGQNIFWEKKVVETRFGVEKFFLKKKVVKARFDRKNVICWENKSCENKICWGENIFLGK